MPKPPPAVNTGNTRFVRGVLGKQRRGHGDAVAHGAGGFGREQRLAAQHAVLIGKGEAHDFELVLLDRALDLARRARLFGAPQAVAVDEIQRG